VFHLRLFLHLDAPPELLDPFIFHPAHLFKPNLLANSAPSNPDLLCDLIFAEYTYLMRQIPYDILFMPFGGLKPMLAKSILKCLIVCLIHIDIRI